MDNLAKQKDAFLNYEANSWFERNKNVLDQYTVENDRVVSLTKKYFITPLKILEIGCSFGYRLNGMRNVFPHSEVFGIEPSINAVEFGASLYSNVHITQGTIDDLNRFEDDQFDLVIVGFVFYVVDRKILLKSISEVDRVLKDQAHLVVIDFFSESPVRKNYHHINDFEAFTFKQNYEAAFLSTHLYHLIDKSSYNHQTQCCDSTSPFQDLYSISLLKKDLNASYR